MITATTAHGRALQKLRELVWKRHRAAAHERQVLTRRMKADVHAALLLQRFAIVSAYLAGNFKSAPAMEHKGIMDFIAARLTDPIRFGIRAAFGLGISSATETVLNGQRLAIGSDLAEHYLKTVGETRIALISTRTERVVRGVIAQGVSDGKSTQEIAGMIFRQANPGGVFSEERAQLIAETEIGDAYNTAVLETVKGAASVNGLVYEKRWVTSGVNPCPECTSNEGDGWISVDDAFSSGSTEPLEHVNCQCELEFRTSDDAD